MNRTSAFHWVVAVAAWLAGAVLGLRAAPVQFALSVHSEDRYHPNTPDYVADPAAYRSARAALLDFAGRLAANNVRWNWQSDWNFLLAVKQFEVDQPDQSLLAETGGTNIVRLLREGFGVEVDPHSHENDGYNFADVAYLISQVGVTPSGVVGGHVWDPADSGFQNWPRFATGLASSKFPGAYVWTPHLLTGEGTGSHEHDTAASGFWFPAGTNDYFSPAATGALAAFGTWSSFADPQRSQLAVTNLLPLVESGTLPTNALWTAGLVLPMSEFTRTGWLDGTFTKLLGQLTALRDAGRIEFVQFEAVHQKWREQFASRGAVYVRNGTVKLADGSTNSPPSTNAPTGSDYISFSLNTQDFAYPELSAATLNRVLDLHERTGVPVDVFLTTWMVDIYERDYPALLSRLTNSPVVALSYHTRPPLPYRLDFDWLSLSNRPAEEVADLVRHYESHGLDLVTGQTTGSAGGSTKLAALAGYPPFIVGVESDAAIASSVVGVFREIGARFQVNHGRALNLGSSRLGLLQRPEHDDLRLFEKTGEEPAQIVADAFARAHATTNSGGAAPWFVGVKMHDNDFFAEDSAWLTTYLHRLSPPWNLSKKSPLLDAAAQAEMWRLYEGVVNHVATNGHLYQPINARGLLRLLGTNGPTVVTLEPSAANGGNAAGSLVGTLAADALGPVSFRLIAGAGDTDNSRVTIQGSQVRLAAASGSESPTSLSFRVRAMDTQGLLVDAPVTAVVDPYRIVQVTIAADGTAAWSIRWTGPAERGYGVERAEAPMGPWQRLAEIELTQSDGEWTARVPKTATATGFFRIVESP